MIVLFFYDFILISFLWLTQGTVVEGTIQQLFEGHHMNYIECISVDYKSTRKESFYGAYFSLSYITVLFEIYL